MWPQKRNLFLVIFDIFLLRPSDFPKRPIHFFKRLLASASWVPQFPTRSIFRNGNFLITLLILPHVKQLFIWGFIPFLLLIFKVFSHGHFATFQRMVLLDSWLISTESSVQRLGSWNKRLKSLQVADTACKSWGERFEKIFSFISSGRSMNLLHSLDLALTMFMFQLPWRSLIDCCKRERHVNLYCVLQRLIFFKKKGFIFSSEIWKMKPVFPLPVLDAYPSLFFGSISFKKRESSWVRCLHHSGSGFFQISFRCLSGLSWGFLWKFNDRGKV